MRTPLHQALEHLTFVLDDEFYQGDYYESGKHSGILQAIELLEGLLTEEEDSYIDFAQEYKAHCLQQEGTFPDSPRTFFNNKFNLEK